MDPHADPEVWRLWIAALGATGAVLAVAGVSALAALTTNIVRRKRRLAVDRARR